MNTEEKNQEKKGSGKRKARILTVQALYHYDLGQRTKDFILNLEWLIEIKAPSAESVKYYQTMIHYVLDNLEEIDRVLKSFLTKEKPGKFMPIDRAILRYGIGALFYEKELPAEVIINEAIEIAKEYSGDDAYKFINGVLDGVLKKNPR